MTLKNRLYNLTHRVKRCTEPDCKGQNLAYIVPKNGEPILTKWDWSKGYVWKWDADVPLTADQQGLLERMRKATAAFRKN